jgi:hypothetical protein
MNAPLGLAKLARVSRRCLPVSYLSNPGTRDSHGQVRAQTRATPLLVVVIALATTLATAGEQSDGVRRPSLPRRRSHAPGQDTEDKLPVE